MCELENLCQTTNNLILENMGKLAFLLWDLRHIRNSTRNLFCQLLVLVYGLNVYCHLYNLRFLQRKLVDLLNCEGGKEMNHLVLAKHICMKQEEIINAISAENLAIITGHA